MKSRCLWACLLWLCLHMAGVELFAQTNNRVTGSVRDSLGTGLENCTVLLYAANDSLPVAGTSTDRNGFYTLSADTGYYQLEVTHVGYEPAVYNIHVQQRQPAQCRVILSRAVNRLNEVVIRETQDRMTMEVERDKFVYKIPERIKRASADTYLALTSLPMLDVDPVNRKVGMFGKKSPLIMVNGIRRDSKFLMMIDPRNIDRVEVTQFPGVRYTLRGMDAIINIVTKERVIGYYGMVDVQQDPALQTGRQSFAFNSARDKWTYRFYVQNFYMDEYGGNTMIHRDTRLPDNEWEHFDRYTVKRAPYKRCEPFAQFTTDYQHSKNSFSTLKFSYVHTKDSKRSHYNEQEQRPELSAPKLYEAFEKSGNVFQRGTVDFYHETAWKDKHTLSVDADYKLENIDSDNRYLKNEPAQTSFFNNEMRYYSLQHDLEAQVNMQHRLTKKWTLEEGYRFNWQQKDYFNRTNGVQENVLFHETRNNIYADVWYDVTSKWSFRAGLNMEFAALTMNGRTYSFPELLPSFLARYQVKNGHYLMLNYTRNRQIPGLTMLSPVASTTIDSVRIYVGNPDLGASHRNTACLSYQYITSSKFYIYTDISYEWGSSISTLSTLNEKGQNIITYDNAAKRRTPSFSLNVSGEVLKGWRIGLKGTVGYQMNSDPNQPQFNRDLWTSKLNLESNYSYKKFYAFLYFPICYRQNTLTGYEHFINESHFSASYRINRSWAVSLNMRYFQPIFYKTVTDIDGYYEYYRSTMGRTFRVLLGANYTFNKGRTSQEKQQKVKSYGRSMEADVKKY